HYASGKLFATNNGAVFLSTDQGVTWQDASSALNTAVYAYMMTSDATTIYLATDGGIWTRPLSEFGPASVSASIDVHRLAVSPNPAASTLELSNIPANARSLNVLNSLGQVVLKAAAQTGSVWSIDISSLSAGSYIAQILNVEGSYSTQFVKH
ncbi:MAG TPA: T9SS type A sorting domain-containing protein, partial [Candidatus Kapabacteria bacterium]|nr:T9SS type A sorting domain-containing protein [Candidatus Kapabacteria bacterium]